MEIKDGKELSRVVRYHNDLSLLHFEDFNANELNIFFAMCSILKRKGKEEVTLTYREIADIAGVKLGRSISRMDEMLKSLDKKILKTKLKIVTEEKISAFSVFNSLDFREKNVIGISVNEKCLYLLNEIDNNFTRFELQEYTSLKSKYAKELYRQLKRFKTSGERTFSASELRDIMCCKDLETKKFNQKIIKVAMKECSEYIKELKVETKKNGRNIVAYKFTFKRERVKKDKGKEIKSNHADENTKPLSLKTHFHNFPKSTSKKHSKEYLNELYEVAKPKPKQKLNDDLKENKKFDNRGNVPLKTRFHNFEPSNAYQYSKENLDRILEESKYSPSKNKNLKYTHKKALNIIRVSMDEEEQKD